MNTIRELVGKNIRRARTEKGFSQEKLAYRAKLYPNYLGLVERGQKNIGIDALARIAKILEMDIEEFFKH